MVGEYEPSGSLYAPPSVEFSELFSDEPKLMLPMLGKLNPTQ